MSTAPLKDEVIDFSSIWQKLTYPLRILADYPKTSFIFIFFGIGMALFLQFTLPKVYEASAIILPYDKTDQFYFNVLEDIQKLVKSNDSKNLAAAFKISQKQAETFV